MEGLEEESKHGVSRKVMAAKFHNTLVEMITEIARLAGVERVCLAGGCFQNRLLLEKTVERLQREGFSPSFNQRIPSNDGGVSVGQAVAAVKILRRVTECV